MSAALKATDLTRLSTVLELAAARPAINAR